MWMVGYIHSKFGPGVGDLISKRIEFVKMLKKLMWFYF